MIFGSFDEHRVSEAEEAVLFLYSFAVNVQRRLAPHEGADKHQQSALRQVEIGNQGIHRLNFLAGIDENRCVARAGAHGRQSLTMCMGLGCNAVGVTGCRIMTTREEKLIAACTNAMIPCNGRFPMLLTMGTVLLRHENSVLLALILLAAVCVGASGSLLVSAAIGKALRRKSSAPFVLELPAYRRPRLKKILNDAIFVKTLHVLSRALLVAAPAGLLLWVFGVWQMGGKSLLQWIAHALDGVGQLMGMNGAILLGFLFAIPANELAIPVILMLLTQQNTLSGAQGLDAAMQLINYGITGKTAICCLIFCVFHWPCSTTLLSIKRETGSIWWTLLSAVIPTAVGALLCVVINVVF